MPDKLTLKQIRRLHDLTIEDVAKELKISSMTWINYENGRTMIPTDKFLYYCEWLEVRPDSVKI